MKEQKKLRLTIDVTYEPNGVSVETLKEMLDQTAVDAANYGAFTGETPAVVAEWLYTVDEFCMNSRHETPCPLPCVACEHECQEA